MYLELESEFTEQLALLETAEDFLDYFVVDYDPELVEKKHIPLLRLFQKLLACKPNADYVTYQKSLRLAYKQISLGHDPMISAGGCASCASDCSESGE